MKLNIKTLLLLPVCTLCLLALTGCIAVPVEDGGHGHEGYGHHDAVVVAPVPVVVVGPPVVFVR
jgi:hypothetical protein